MQSETLIVVLFGPWSLGATWSGVRHLYMSCAIVGRRALSQRVLVEVQGLMDALDRLVGCLWSMCRLLMKHLVMGSG
jgi:hypothetical protein